MTTMITITIMIMHGLPLPRPGLRPGAREARLRGQPGPPRALAVLTCKLYCYITF